MIRGSRFRATLTLHAVLCSQFTILHRRFRTIPVNQPTAGNPPTPVRYTMCILLDLCEGNVCPGCRLCTLRCTIRAFLTSNCTMCILQIVAVLRKSHHKTKGHTLHSSSQHFDNTRDTPGIPAIHAHQGSCPVLISANTDTTANRPRRIRRQHGRRSLACLRG